MAVSTAGRDHRTGTPPEDERYAQLLADVQRLLRDPMLRGLTLEGLALVGGTNRIAHKLGRVPRGWFSTRTTGANTFHAREIARDDRYLTLELLLDCTVDLRVF